MNIQKIIVGQLDVNCYIISDEATSEALIVDPGDESDRIIEFIEAARLKPKFILVTHAHYDHVCAAGELHDRYKAIFLMHEKETATYRATTQLCISWGFAPEDFPEPDKTLKDGDTISVGPLSFRVLHTPGHTAGSICLQGENMLFSGDTLFRGSVGRTDLPGGDSDLLSRSLERLMLLPRETKVMCGHNGETSIAEEIRYNPFLREI
jgi:hydroxyacylglutathione hydrolase